MKDKREKVNKCKCGAEPSVSYVSYNWEIKCSKDCGVKPMTSPLHHEVAEKWNKNK